MVQIIRSRPSGSGTSIRVVVLFVGVVLLVDHLAGAAVSNISQLEAAAKDGYVPQEIELAAAYFTGDGVPKDAKQAAYWYQKAAESGDPEAQKEIGFFYQAGIGVPIDPAKAMHWYQMSAASGLVSAKVNLGVMYVWGISVPKNEALALQLFQEAANKGNGTGASYLGDLYYFGIGVEQDKAAAEKWYETGAKLRDAIAAYNLGSLFSVAADHPHDLRKAAVLLRQSAIGGYVPAMHSLGLLLVNHTELAKSPQEATSHLEAAANAGSWKSSVVLGLLARDGKGVAADSKVAYYHFQVAILQGGEPAMRLVQSNIQALTYKLGTQQTKVLDSDANAWYEHHQVPLLFVYKDGDKRQRFPASALAVSTGSLHAGQLLSTPAS